MQGGRGAVLAFTDITERLASEKAIRERDAAEIRAAESQAAQRRILESATVARHQVARDLHDGAQQRLVTLRSDCSWLGPDSLPQGGPDAPGQCDRTSRRRIGRASANWRREFTHSSCRAEDCAPRSRP